MSANGLVDCGECRTQGCPSGKCRNAERFKAEGSIVSADIKLRTSIERWRKCDPATIANGSKAQCFYCIDDARADILTLAAALAAQSAMQGEAERFFPHEFEVWCNDEMVASASGPREDAMREAMNYAAQYQEDGPTRIFEVTRTLVDPANPGAQQQAECTWRSDDEGVWHPGCGGDPWFFTDGGPAENNVEHCMRCGKKVALPVAADKMRDEKGASNAG